MLFGGLKPVDSIGSGNDKAGDDDDNASFSMLMEAMCVASERFILLDGNASVAGSE